MIDDVTIVESFPAMRPELRRTAAEPKRLARLGCLYALTRTNLGRARRCARPRLVDCEATRFATAAGYRCGSMSASHNVNTVKAIYDAFGRADLATILDAVTDNVDWATEGDTGAAPWYGQRTGKDQVASFFSDIGSTVEVSEFTPLSFAANDDNEVHALVRFGIRSRHTGREATMNLHHYWRFRDGKVEYYRGSEDTAQTAAILSRSAVEAL